MVFKRIIKNLFSERNPKKENIKVKEVFSDKVVLRILKLMFTYALRVKPSLPQVGSFLGENDREFSTMEEYIGRLDFLLENSPVESLPRYNYEDELYRYFRTTQVGNLFDAIELYAKVLAEACNKCGDWVHFNAFIQDFNDLLDLNGAKFRLVRSQEGIIITKVTTNFTEKALIEPLLSYTSDKHFADANDLFSKALSCFARGDNPNALKYCNSTIESILLKILNKGSGDINSLYEEFKKKFKVPRVYENKADLIYNLIKKIQTVRSDKGELHAKNNEVDKENVDEFIDEITELTINQTASFGIYLIKVYNKNK